MLHTKFRENLPTGSGEEDFEGFLPYVGMAAILVMGPASCHQIFISLYLKAFIKNLVQICKVVSETSSPKSNDRSPESQQVIKVF